MQDTQNEKIGTKPSPLHSHMDTNHIVQVVKSECIGTSSYGTSYLSYFRHVKNRHTRRKNMYDEKGEQEQMMMIIRTRNVGGLDGAQARVLHDGIGMRLAVVELGGLVGSVGHLVGILI